MTLFDILEKFKSGIKIRRASWNGRLFVEYREPGISRLYILEDEGIKLLDADMHYTTSDIMANDWEIYLDRA